jgi:hypothetical protein
VLIPDLTLELTPEFRDLFEKNTETPELKIYVVFANPITE